MTKIIIEILDKDTSNGDVVSWIVAKSKTVDIGNVTEKNKELAKSKLLELKSTLTTNQKIRVLEYHNDDPDETRQGCKILFES